MKKILLSIFLFLILIVFTSKAYARPSAVTQLVAAPECVEKQGPTTDGSKLSTPTLNFSWYVQGGTANTSYIYYFWQSSNGTPGTGQDLTNWERLGENVSRTSRSYNNTSSINWSVKRCDKDPGFDHGCSDFTQVSATPPNCSQPTCETSQVGGSCKSSCNQLTEERVSTGTCTTGVCCRPLANPYGDCQNRTPACSNLTTYPSDKCVNFPQGALHECPSTGNGATYKNCAMTNPNDPNKAYSCAFNSGFTCRAEGNTGCTLDSDCCSGFCDGRTKPGGGVCKGSQDRGGQSCDPANPNCMPGNYCRPDATDSTKGTCQSSSEEFRNPANPYSAAATPTPFCTDNQIKNGNCNIDTGLGLRINSSPGGFIKSILGLLLGVIGGIALIIIIISGYRLMVSQGNPEKIQAAREQLTAAIVGLMFVIFSLVILQVIGYNILRLPGFSQ